MAKIYGVHRLKLREGVSEEDLEKFVTDRMADLHQFEGLEWHLCKCDDGDTIGEYVSLFVIESVGRRQELRDGMEDDTEFVPTWREMHSMVTSTWSDYVVICE